MASGVQTIRLRKPASGVDEKKPQTVAPTALRHNGLLQDQINRSKKRPWTPSFQNALRILLLVRTAAAMYSNIQDCDEVFNFWEPLHYLDRGQGFQTWETSPVYAIRSWAYIALHLPIAKLVTFFLGVEKRPVFFGLRIVLGAISALAETILIRKVVDKVNERVGKYLFFMLLFNAGMINAANAFLPSTFAMYTTTAALAYSIAPAGVHNYQRTYRSTFLFALGAIVGWPFALALAIPFVIEELFVFSGDKVAHPQLLTWRLARWKKQFAAGIVAALIFIPVVAIDSIAYGRSVVVPWNIVSYNIFGGSGRGPELYGTSPWYFYIQNLILNFNVLFPLAIASLPALLVTYFVDRKRLGPTKVAPDSSSPFTVLGLRLLPLYVWLSILTAQPHKEERFMTPAYTLICFNAAVTLYLVRGWLEVAFIRVTKSPYKATRTKIFARVTLLVVLTSAFLSLSRVASLFSNYHNSLSIYNHFEAEELPKILRAHGIIPEIPKDAKLDDLPRVDLGPIKQFNLTLCLGKEWYRFPSHYLVPDGVRVEFIKSEFDGALPAHFSEDLDLNAAQGQSVANLWKRHGTRTASPDLNDLNKEVPSLYVPDDSCDYIIDSDYPLHPSDSYLEPRYAVDRYGWERLKCLPFLDAAHSPLLSRTLWLPTSEWTNANEYGDYCLLRNKRRSRE